MEAGVYLISNNVNGNYYYVKFGNQPPKDLVKV